MKLTKVFQWEFLKYFKSKQFLIMTILMPLIIGMFSFLPRLFESFSENEAQALLVVDETGAVYDALAVQLVDTQWQPTQGEGSLDELKATVAQAEYDGLLWVDAKGVESSRVTLFTHNPVGAETWALQLALSEVFNQYRLAQAGFDPAQIGSLTRPISMESVVVGQKDQGRRGFVISIGLAMLLMMGSMFSGSMVLYTVVKEKSGRVVELLLSSVTAKELMMGKVLGYGLTGLIQILIWGVLGFALANYYLDVSLDALELVQILSYPFYFVLGYLSIASIYAILGAGMKDLQSSNQLQGLVTLLPVVPLIMASAILATPDVAWIRIMSFIPPFTPGVMMLRMSVTSVPWWEIGVSLILLTLYVYVLMRFAAKIFEVGLLMYGKSASLKELWRWGMQRRTRTT